MEAPTSKDFFQLRNIEGVSMKELRRGRGTAALDEFARKTYHADIQVHGDQRRIRPDHITYDASPQCKRATEIENSFSWVKLCSMNHPCKTAALVGRTGKAIIESIDRPGSTRRCFQACSVLFAVCSHGSIDGDNTGQEVIELGKLRLR